MKTSHTDTTEQASHGTIRSYTLGFALSIIATLLPYYALTHNIVTPTRFIAIAVAAAIIQLFVQLVLFLHLSLRRSSAINTVLVTYTGVMVLCIVIGTLWVMYHLKANMGMDNNVYKDHVYTPQGQAY
jgi:cytochrome o ubiquinol oxidase operon protein cyoD